MKSLLSITCYCIAVSCLLVCQLSFSAGLLKPVNSSYAELKISEHHVKVVIEDGYATTHIEQVFSNPNAMDLEANYSFPVPEQAAVGEFAYWIDGKPVKYITVCMVCESRAEVNM